MEVRYPLLSKILEPFAENQDWFNLLEAIITLSSKGVRSLLCKDLIPEMFVIPVGNSSGSYQDSLVLNNGKLVCTNKLLIGTFEILTEGVTFDSGKTLETVDGVVSLVSTEPVDSVAFRRVSGFDGVSIPKGLLTHILNKCSYNNAVYASYMLGTLVKDIKFDILGAHSWTYYTSITSLGGGFANSTFKFLPKAGEFVDIIEIPTLGKTVEVISSSGNLLKLSESVPQGEYEVSVKRMMGTYTAGYLNESNLPLEVVEDLPVTLLSKNSDYRLSIVPFQIEKVSTLANEITLVVLGTDQWQITEYSDCLTLSTTKGTGATVLSVQVAENTTGLVRDLFITFKPFHSTEITVRMRQMADAFGVTFSWGPNMLFDPIEYTESMAIIGNIPWRIQVDYTGDYTDWIQLSQESGDTANKGVVVDALIKGPELPYLSEALERRAIVSVSSDEDQFSNITEEVVQRLEPIFKVEYPTEITSSATRVTVRVTSNFEYEFSYLGPVPYSGTFTKEDMKNDIINDWYFFPTLNNTGDSREFKFTITRSFNNETKEYTVVQSKAVNIPDSLVINVTYHRLVYGVYVDIYAEVKGVEYDYWSLQWAPYNVEMTGDRYGDVVYFRGEVSIPFESNGELDYDEWVNRLTLIMDLNNYDGTYNWKLLDNSNTNPEYATDYIPVLDEDGKIIINVSDGVGYSLRRR